MQTNLCSEIHIAMDLCMKINSPRSLCIYMLLDNHQYEDYLELEINAFHYSDAQCFRSDYMLTKYLSKYKYFDTSFDLDKRALDLWEEAESSNFETNYKFDNIAGLSSPVSAILYRAQRKIANVLGVFNFSKVHQDMRWTSGATYDHLYGTHIEDKISKTITVTKSALLYINEIYLRDPHWLFADGGYDESKFSVVEYNKLITVPKSSKINRVICKEPTGNMFLQTGVGRFLRARLKRFGIDLDDQSKNQRLAACAAVSGFATIDLRSASDMISSSLVRSLLPIDWYVYLDDIRSQFTLLPSKEVRHVSKFSSMGNGFTFELESLIFWAITTSVIESIGGLSDNVSVYGDDIIVPSRYCTRVCFFLEEFGFKVNESKTFSTGLFYESCGKHYFDSVDVTPVYQKERTHLVHEHIRSYNRLYRWLNECAHCKPRYLEKLIPLQGKLPRIPVGTIGDDGYLSLPHNFSYDKNKGFNCLVLRPKRIMYDASHESHLYAWALRSSTAIGDTDGRQRIGLPNIKYKYSRTWILPNLDFHCVLKYVKEIKT